MSDLAQAAEQFDPPSQPPQPAGPDPDTFDPDNEQAETQVPALSDQSRSPYLRIFGADDGCRQVDLTWEPQTIGRSAKADIHLSDKAVSREHARLTVHDGAYLIEDLRSKCGTFVNGKQIDQPTRLKHGDSIQIVQFVLQYRTDSVGPQILPGKFGLLPSSMGVRYRFVHYNPREVFTPGDTLPVGEGGILLPFKNDPPEGVCVELELAWPDGKRRQFLGELLCMIPAEVRMGCIKLHQIGQKTMESVLQASNREDWVTVNEPPA